MKRVWSRRGGGGDGAGVAMTTLDTYSIVLSKLIRTLQFISELHIDSACWCSSAWWTSCDFYVTELYWMLPNAPRVLSGRGVQESSLRHLHQQGRALLLLLSNQILQRLFLTWAYYQVTVASVCGAAGAHRRGSCCIQQSAHCSIHLLLTCGALADRGPRGLLVSDCCYQIWAWKPGHVTDIFKCGVGGGGSFWLLFQSLLLEKKRQDVTAS